MVTIKGPITINSPNDNSFFEAVKDAGGSVKLPFEATGMKTSLNDGLIPESMKEVVKKKVEKKKVKKEEKKRLVKEKSLMKG